MHMYMYMCMSMYSPHDNCSRFELFSSGGRHVNDWKLVELKPANKSQPS